MTTSIIDRLETLEPQLETLRDAATERDALQALRTRMGQIKRSKEALEVQLALYERVERLGGTVVSRPRVSAPLRAKASVLKARLEQAPTDVLDAAQWDGSFMEPLGVFTSRLEETALVTWQTLIDEKAPTVGDDVLKQFEQAGFSQQVKDVRLARDRIRQLRGSLPVGDTVLEEAIALSSAATRELTALADVPYEVRAFIQKAAVSEALIGDLTSSVKEWLEERDMLKLIRIRLAQ